MRKFAIGWFIVALVSSTWIDVAIAGSVFESPVVCDLNSDGTWGGDGDGTGGTVVITKAGKFTFSMEGVVPGTEFFCELICTGEPVYVGTEAGNCGTAGSNGKVSVTIRDAVDFATLCRGPVVVFATDNPENGWGQCETGWGTGTDDGSGCSGCE